MFKKEKPKMNFDDFERKIHFCSSIISFFLEKQKNVTIMEYLSQDRMGNKLRNIDLYPKSSCKKKEISAINLRFSVNQRLTYMSAGVAQIGAFQVRPFFDKVGTIHKKFIMPLSDLSPEIGKLVLANLDLFQD
jgi:hypothetical protein